MANGWWKFPTALAVGSILSASPAKGQAAQTWVSGTGTSDVCTRAQPCRTFAQAYVKTATGGQIQVISSGEFGRLDIKKSITIRADGVVGSIVVTAFNGITINAPASARVVLDGLDIDGTPDGVVGILVVKAGEVVVRNTTIRNFSSAGIHLNNLGATGSINLTVDNVMIHNADTGIWVTSLGGNSRAYVWNSKIIDSSIRGIRAYGEKSRVEIAGNVINRTPQSLDIQSGAVIASYGDNVLSEGDAPSSVLKK